MDQADEALQLEVTRVLLGVVGDAGFALAGAGAIRAHGLTARPTHDVDLFTSALLDEGVFASAVGRRRPRARGQRI